MSRRMVAAVIVVAAEAAAAATFEPLFPFPPGATDIRQRRDPELQYDAFIVRVRYPGTSVVEHFRMALAAWRACDPEEKDWQSFVVKGNLAHQRDRHWVNDRDDTTVMVSMRYTSNGPRERAKPDTERLSVIVSRDSTPQAAASRYLNGEVCEGYTPPKRVGNICWVRRVEKHPEGLRVYFHDVGRLVVRVRRADAPEERDVYAISSDGIVRRGKEERDHVPMKDGDTASLNQMEHDNCMFSASDKPGRSGVSAESRMWLPGLRPQSAEQFIEAVDPASPAK